LIITITDINGTKSYNIHQILKKSFAVILLGLFFVIGGSFWFISILNEEITDVKEIKQKELQVFKEKKEKELQFFKDKKENEYKKLEKKELGLLAQIEKKSVQFEELNSKLDDIEELIGVKKNDETSLIQRLTLARLTSEQKMFMLQSIPNGAPLSKLVITEGYGYRIHPVLKKRKFHRGVDLKAKYNTKIYATADGVIKYVQSKNIGSWGRVIKIAHNFGFETVYAHLNKTKVKIGDIVKKGQLIGLTGNSGRSTGPHLHYEVSYASKVLNPRDYMKWNLKNYEYIFAKQRRVQWESLVSLINTHQKTMVQR
jgi:murein DD-endopeptidase MepM/ murein hydrolase activator NlpD